MTMASPICKTMASQVCVSLSAVPDKSNRMPGLADPACITVVILHQRPVFAQMRVTHDLAPRERRAAGHVGGLEFIDPFGG